MVPTTVFMLRLIRACTFSLHPRHLVSVATTTRVIPSTLNQAAVQQLVQTRRDLCTQLPMRSTISGEACSDC